MNGLLKFSGYSLIDNNQRTQELKNTLSKPLPTIDRNFGLMSLKEGLMILIGLVFSLAPDSLNRIINFDLKSQFKISKKEEKKNREIKYES